MNKEALWTANISNEFLRRLGPIMINHGEGIYLFDNKGKKYIDAMSGAWVVNTGHGRKEIACAIEKQASKLGFLLQEGYISQPSLELADKIISMLPDNIVSCLFACGGSESIEGAIKAIKQYYFLEGNYRKTKILCRQHSYHGATYGAMSLTGILGWRNPFGKGIPGVRYVPHPYCYKCEYMENHQSCDLQCVKEMRRIIEKEGADTIAAFIAEPVSMSAGTAIPPVDYWHEVGEICRENNIKIILDEIITGFGRTGKWFGYEHWNIKPDVIVLAKGLTGGYAPLSAIAVSKDIHARLEGPGFVHGYTYSGHPIGCVAALENLEILEKEGLVEGVTNKGKYLQEVLFTKLSHLDFIGEIRVFGLMGTIELVKDKLTKERYREGFADDIKVKLVKHGILTRVGSQINLGPPFITSFQQIDELCEKIYKALANVRGDDYI